MSLLLRNCLIVDPESPKNQEKCNIQIEDGIITSLDGSKGEKELDLEGKPVSPGWFDLNANFNDPGNEHKEDINSGVAAAVAGGFTDVQVISDTNPPLATKSDVEYVKNRSHHSLDLYVSASLSEGMKGENLNEILDLHSAGASSFSDGDFPIWNSELILKSLQYTSLRDVPVFQNPRDIHLSSHTQMHEGRISTMLGMRGEPSISEVLVIKRDLDILRYTGGKLHFSKISTLDSVNLIADAKAEGLSVTADVAIHSLLFTDESVQDFDSNFKAVPPFRSEADRKALVAGVNSGVVDCICSNHRPQDLESKQLEYDLAEPGSLSLQTFYSNYLSLEKEIPYEIFVQRITTGPRSILGLQEVSIREGMPAKLTVVDPTCEWVFDSSTCFSKSKNTPFWGKKLAGKVYGTVNNGHYNF